MWRGASWRKGFIGTYLIARQKRDWAIRRKHGASTKAVTSTYIRTGIYAEEKDQERFILDEKRKPAKNRRVLISFRALEKPLTAQYAGDSVRFRICYLLSGLV